MSKKLIEEQIREHYTAQNGEWLVEKGKVKEAKLLKEACLTIERLRKSCNTSEANYFRLLKEYSNKDRDLEAREKAVAEREQRFEERKASFIDHFEKWV